MIEKNNGKQIIALSGGIGGAKLVLGLSKVLAAQELLVVTNTGDDFDHFGLRICPDTKAKMIEIISRIGNHQ